MYIDTKSMVEGVNTTQQSYILDKHLQGMSVIYVLSLTEFP